MFHLFASIRVICGREFCQALTNGAGGDIVGRGTLVVGGAGLTNTGDVALSNGQTDVFGDAGFSVSGGGGVYLEADVTPGSSPGVETFGGNVRFGALANLEIELAGLDSLSAFGDVSLTILDALTVSGTFANVRELNDGAGTVDALDIQNILAANLFGQGVYAALPSSVAAVPEPSSIALSLGGTLSLVFYRWRRPAARRTQSVTLFC